MALVLPVVACCEVLCYRARSAADAVREACATEGPCGTVSPVTFDSIKQLNDDLISARQALQPLLATGVVFCMMWGNLIAIVWLGGNTISL